MAEICRKGGGGVEQQSRRQRKKEETKRRILEVAFRLFSEQGFENTTVDQITVGADVGKGTFYNYFSSKEAALSEFMEELSRTRGEKIWPQIKSSQNSRARLAVTFKSMAAWFEEYPELVKLYMLDRINLALKNSSNWSPNHFELFLVEIMQMGQETGDIRQDVTALQLVNYLNGIILIQLCLWFSGGTASGLYGLFMDGVDFFLIGALKH